MQTTYPNTTMPALRHKPQARYVIGGGLFAAALVLLMATDFTNTAQHFYMVNELLAHRAELGVRSVRATGAVVGDTITVNPEALEIRFEMARLRDERELTDLAAAGAPAPHTLTGAGTPAP